MPSRLTRKRVILGVVVALPLLIGGGYLSNLITITACEAEARAFSKEEWTANGFGQNGYIGESKQAMPYVVEIELGLPKAGMVARRYLCLFGKPVVIGNSPKVEAQSVPFSEAVSVSAAPINEAENPGSQSTGKRSKSTSEGTTQTTHGDMVLIVDAVPDLKMSLDEFRSEFGGGIDVDDAKRKRFDGKIVEVSGIVTGFGFSDGLAERTTVLLTEDGSDPCPVATWNSRPWTEILPGQKAVLRIQIYLPAPAPFVPASKSYDHAVNAVIAKVEGETSLKQLSAADLMKVFVADPASADRDWIDQPIVIEGRVRSREDGVPTLFLDTDSDVPIRCDEFSYADAERVNPNDTVRLLGTYTDRFDDKQPRLLYCKLISPSGALPEPFTLNLKTDMDGDTPVFTADSLVMLFRSNPGEFRRRFGRRSVRVKGVVNAVDNSFPRVIKLYILNKAGHTLTCSFDESSIPDGTIAEGAEVVFEGELSGSTISDVDRNESLDFPGCKLVGK